MILLDQNDELIEITLYYVIKKVGTGKRIVVLDDKKAEEMLKDEVKKKEVDKITTKWKLPNWKEQNDINDASYKFNIDPIIGQPGPRQFNFITYRDQLTKKSLKAWDLTTVEGKPVPLTPENIDKMSAEVINSLYNKFSELIEYNEEELKK